MSVGVYGLGRFGLFWAELLSVHFPVVAYNRTPGRSVPDGVREVDLDDLMQADTIFLCTAISAMEPVLRQIAPLLRAGTTVIDTCSVKVYPIRLMEEILPATVSLIGTHPMFGPDSAVRGVQGLPLILTPVRAPVETVSAWEEAFRQIGLVIHRMTAAEHDYEAAYTQGVTHFIGRVLRDLDLKPSSISTLGYRKLLEVMEQTCNDPWQLFVDLQRLNPYTGEMRNNLRASVDRIVEHFGDRRSKTDKSD
ncbi:MAG TPA: prephenate dehydrogenase/arogenate dehydrogenase family protein [Spirochaetia bacterium]|nr:prephenate dehydrogenase/arogenate dehydrogenase family protein [Spirochaetia bacterium]